MMAAAIRQPVCGGYPAPLLSSSCLTCLKYRTFYVIISIHIIAKWGSHMTIIRPISDMQRRSGEISKLAKETQEPIYLTKNGLEYLVLVDADLFDRMQQGDKEIASHPQDRTGR